MSEPSRDRGRRRIGLVLFGMAIGAAAPQAFAADGPDVFDSLLPGRLTGALTPYVVKRGDTITSISTRFAIHPIRIYKPNREALADGLEFDERLNVDLRRVTPRFAPDVSGVVLNIPEAQVYVVQKGRLETEYPVAVSTSDRKAPLGRTRVVSMTKNPTWHVPVSIQKEMAEAGKEVKTSVPPGPENPLGNRWIGWADGTFGFHGTLFPSSIKRYASHGCVRFLRPHIEDLYDRVKVGTPVRVLYQPVLLAADARAVWLSVYPDVYKLDYDFKGVVRAQAIEAGVLDRISWPAVERVIKSADGIVMDVAIGSQPSPRPSKAPTPRPTVHPTARPTASPSAIAPSPIAPSPIAPSPIVASPSEAPVPEASPSPAGM